MKIQIDDEEIQKFSLTHFLKNDYEELRDSKKYNKFKCFYYSIKNTFNIIKDLKRFEVLFRYGNSKNAVKVWNKYLKKGIKSLTNKEIIIAFSYTQYNDEDIKKYPVEYEKLRVSYFKLYCDYNKKNDLYFPPYGHINSEFDERLTFIDDLTNALNKLDGVTASGGNIFNPHTNDFQKISWWLTFENTDALNHFLWASCYRYIPFQDWTLCCDIGDPHYNEKEIKMNLGYMILDESIEKMKEVVENFTKGVNRYAESQYNQVGKSFDEIKNNK